MARTLVLLIIGAVGAGAGVYLLSEPDTGPAEDAAVSSVEPVLTPTRAPGAANVPAQSAQSATGRVAERIAAYENALGATDVVDLETTIGLAATQPESLARDLRIEALLARLSELDPVRAVRFAQSIFLESRFVEQAFRTLALVDADAAVAELARVGSPATKRNASIAVLEALGFAEDAVALIAASLPESERVGFEHDAIIARATVDPAGALQAALALDRQTLKRLVLTRIARVAAERDPRGSLAQAELIEDVALRRSFTNQTLTAWAELDPDAVFAYLETLDPSGLDRNPGVFGVLARRDADRLLEAAAAYPPAARRSAQRAYLQNLAETDPLAALARLDLLPPGQDRASVMSSIAMAYGSRNPDAALAWVRSLPTSDQSALTAVLRGIAQVDFDRAIDEILNEARNSGPERGLAATSSLPYMLVMMSVGTSPAGDTDFVGIANRLAAADDTTARSMFSLMLSRWSNEDHEQALNWALANADWLDASSFRSLASNAAQIDPELAVQTMSRLPVNAREGWLQGVVQGLAQTDLDRAIAFLDGQRGQPGYGNALSSVASIAARTDPVRAARLVEDAGESLQAMSAASMVASQWASRDPRAAAEWARGLENERAQTQSVQNVTRVWATTDPDAAETWVLGLQRGASRDSALDGYLGTLAQSGSLESRLLDAYSSDSARQQGAMRAIVQIGRNDLDEARRLLDLYITDAAMREQIQTQLAQSGGVGDSRVVAPGAVIF